MIKNRREEDKVNHPEHYGGDTTYEVIKVLKAWGLESDALLWNACKYIARAGRKGSAREDLEKARFYLNRRIEEIEAFDKEFHFANKDNIKLGSE